MALRRRREEELKEKVLDVDASMQGTLAFKDPVNLRINGKFEGKLETKGTLTIGEHAVVNADIKGEDIIIAGTVNGDIKAQAAIKLVAPACVVGDIKTPLLSVAEGATLEGHCNMLPEGKGPKNIIDILTIDEVAKYLEVGKDVVLEWASTGKLPAVKEGAKWKFEKSKIEDWLSSEKIK
ncbi:MAG: polymer-forming cytoskeletal protein [Candidatus Omnitrophota bacterium]|nr:MAG: polymer-forming cytoskeletal protein [Candidatus Omnitrophota bacterium]